MKKIALSVILLLTLSLGACGEVVNMANKYCNINGGDKIRETYNDINKGFDAVEHDVNALDTKTDAIDSRVDTIITTPAEDVSAQEIIDARKGKPSLGAKIGEIDSHLAENANYYKENFMKYLANPKIDLFGLKSANIIGDSISHGANAPEIYNDAWSAVLRKAMQVSLETDNHGFVSVREAISSATGQYIDMLYVTHSNWYGENAQDVPGFYKRTTDDVGATISAWVQDKSYKINKLGIGVVKSANGGDIRIDVEGKDIGVQATGTFSLYSDAVTQEILWLDTSDVTDFHKLTITNLGGISTVWGFYLMENTDDVVLNNYSRSGAKIEDLSDGLIDKLFNTNVVIFALGHNSTPSEIDPYLEKCRLAYEKYKPMVYVLDLTWTDARLETARKIEQFAKDCDGLYIEIIPRVSDANDLVTSGFLSDTSHPTPKGHKIIAEKMLSMLHFPISSKNLINLYNQTMRNVTIKKDIAMVAGFTLLSGLWTQTGKLNNVTLEITGDNPLKSGDILCYLDKTNVTLNLIGQLWGTTNGVVLCPFTHSADDGAIKIFPSGGATGNRFTVSYSFESA